MTLDIFEKRIIFVSVEGLFEPLRGLVKAFALSSLQEAIKRALTLEPSVLRNKFHHCQNCLPLDSRRETFKEVD